MAKGRHGGRPSSWLAVATMITGFVIGGFALTMGPTWPLFWAGAAVAVAGAALALTVDIFSDVVMDDPRTMPEGVGQRLVTRRGGAGSGDAAERGTTAGEQTPRG